MEHQKARRDDLKNFARCLAAGDFDEEKEEEDEEEDMDTSGEVNNDCNKLESHDIPMTMGAYSSKKSLSFLDPKS